MVNLQVDRLLMNGIAKMKVPMAIWNDAKLYQWEEAGTLTIQISNQKSQITGAYGFDSVAL